MFTNTVHNLEFVKDSIHPNYPASQMTSDRKLGPLSIVSNQTNVIYRAVDTLKVPQTRSPTNLRHLPDRIGIGTVAFTPHVKESRLRNMGNFYLWNAEYAQGIQNPSKTIGIQNPSSTKKCWNPVPWNPESTAWNPESKTVLDFLIMGSAFGSEGKTGIPVRNTSRPSNEPNPQHIQLLVTI